jgi:hypothetical protein
MNLVNISVEVKNKNEAINLVLFHKIYSTPDGIVNHYSTNQNSDYRLEIIIDDKDVSVNPAKISKDMDIITDEWDLAGRMMLKLYEKGIFQNVKIY